MLYLLVALYLTVLLLCICDAHHQSLKEACCTQAGASAPCSLWESWQPISFCYVAPSLLHQGGGSGAVIALCHDQSSVSTPPVTSHPPACSQQSSSGNFLACFPACCCYGLIPIMEMAGNEGILLSFFVLTKSWRCVLLPVCASCN